MRHNQTPCPGTHNNRWRTAQADYEQHGTPHDLQPVWGQPIHCPNCQATAHTRLAALPHLLVDISLEARNGRFGSSALKLVPTSSNGTTPAWPGQHARILADHIAGALNALEDDIRDLRRLNPRPEYGSESTAVNASVTFLTAHLGWALEHHPLADEPHGGQGGNPAWQIRCWYVAAERFTKQDDLREIQRLAPCPRCHGPYLVTSPDDGMIECRDPDCRRVLTENEYEDYVRAIRTAVKRAA
jgi:hypothetical protein